jgi:hypothetical protein
MRLTHDWRQITSAEPIPGEIPPPRWKFAWSTHPAGARRLYHTVRLHKPRLIVETGTFEGLGTYVLARAAHDAGLCAKIYTVDYDGDPDVSLPDQDWLQLRTYRQENLQRAKQDFPGIEIQFVEGDSRKVLPRILEKAGTPWDLFFQDSMHFTEGIQAEWLIMKPRASPNAVVIFDDVCIDWKKLPAHLSGRKDFCLQFALNEGLLEGWAWRSTTEGRAQFFAQKQPKGSAQ